MRVIYKVIKMKNSITEFMESYLQQVHSLQAVIISDSEGVHIFSSFVEGYPLEKEKCIQISTMLISTAKQANDNYHKVNDKK